MAEKKNAITIYNDHKMGSVQMADNVIADIVGLAATEVEGVACLGGNITHEKIGHLRRKNIFRGVKVDILENVASIRILIDMKYGFNIPETTHQVQDRVKNAVESMTGLQVADVRISVADVHVR